MMTASSHAADWAPFYNATKNEDVPFHAINMYHYSPDIQIMALKQGDKYIARTVVWKDNSGNPSFHGKVYHDNRTSYDTVHKWLRDNNISQVDDRYTPMNSFEVPGYMPDNIDDIICPIPYVDFVDKMYKIKYQTNGNFLFTPTKPGNRNTNPSLQTTKGYVTKKHLEAIRCDSCSYVFGHDTDMSDYASLDGKHFCGTGCASDSGYVHAMREPDVVIYVPRDSACKDKLSRTLWFENKRVAAKYGRPIYIHSLGLPESLGDFGYSTVGHSIKDSSGVEFAISGEDIDIISRNRGFPDTDLVLTPELFGGAKTVHINIHRGEMRLERK
jgi:hypothetical protein